MEFNTPKNFKQGRLISNKYRIVDIFILIVSIFISVFSIILYLQFKGKQIIVILLLILPLAVVSLLLLPHGIYHNYLVYLHTIFLYTKQEKNFIYKGVEYGNQFSIKK